MAVRVQIEHEALPALARYDIRPAAIDELNALIEKKRRRTLPDERQVHLSLDSLLLATKPLFYMREVRRRRRNDEVWFSEPFYCGPEGYKMCLGVYANGESEVRGRYESVFLQLLKGEFDGKLRWPFTGTATVKLLNHSSSCLWWCLSDLEKEIPFTFKQAVRSYQGWSGSEMQNRASVPKFVKLSELHAYDCLYEVDDCSWYEVSVKVEH